MKLTSHTYNVTNRIRNTINYTFTERCQTTGTHGINFPHTVAMVLVAIISRFQSCDVVADKIHTEFGSIYRTIIV